MIKHRAYFGLTDSMLSHMHAYLHVLKDEQQHPECTKLSDSHTHACLVTSKLRCMLDFYLNC